ncbi:protocadherin-11 X-linked [Elysia marginata]|uniref:Protocadherin-11 X-linked n=1 Tax=Elysia marginata TaxID=1093978 RepID=A0AAV4FQ32_9GAST|nr:protocadherin-11 X-linked [Elysia marginata]
MGRITYSIEDRYNGLFIIDPDTGVISVTRPVDREQEAASFEFHVMARDNGAERLTNTSLVVVEVEDENDEPPHFTRPTFLGKILENKPVGSHVGYVTATDPDNAANSKIRYVILQQGTDFGKFRIDGDTGEIKSATVFDREETDRYYLTIQAIDPDNSEFYSTCNFTVLILDDNDHYPIITGITSGAEEVDGSGGNVDSNNMTLIVQYTAPVGSVITQVLAQDGDATGSANAKLHFDIIAGDPEHLFSMNRFDGAISLARGVTAKDIKTFKLTITVIDGGDPPKGDSQDMYIKVNGSLAALAQASSGGISQNILIVIVLIGVTVVLALAILATICLIRKIDRQRRLNRASQKLSEDKMYQLSAQHTDHNNHQNIYTNRGHLDREEDTRGGRSPGVNSSNSFSNNLSKRVGGGGIGGGVGGTKKEVSFSLDEESDSHNTSSGSGNPLTSFKGGGAGGAVSEDRMDGVSTSSRPMSLCVCVFKEVVTTVARISTNNRTINDSVGMKIDDGDDNRFDGAGDVDDVDDDNEDDNDGCIK